MWACRLCERWYFVNNRSMPSLKDIDPQDCEEAEQWIFAREFPLERSLRVAQLLRTRLTAVGCEDVRVSFNGKNEFHIQMKAGTSSSNFDQHDDMGQFIFGVVNASGNAVVANWIPHFRFYPTLDVRFRLVSPLV